MRWMIVGAGAIGATLAAWMDDAGLDVTLVARPRSALILARGIPVRGASGTISRNVRVVASVAEAGDADFAILTTKSGDVASAAEDVRARFGPDLPALALQNGAAHLTVLPTILPRTIFGIAAYNVWCESDGVFGARERGPVAMGATTPDLDALVRSAARELGRALPVRVTDRIVDAIHHKIVVNLANSITTLVGAGFREVPDRADLRRMTTAVLWEGMRVIRGAGYRPVSGAGMPPPAILWAGARLPDRLTRRLIERNMGRMAVSSMAQDVIGRGRANTELDAINGRIVELAREHGIDAPLNTALYDLCREEFAKGAAFVPWNPARAWTEIRGRAGAI
ncbi:MAG: ketopantoate reductase family protein [Deltaproteobacteria bacterium]|nr:ketopantoate reductase family protein [Deltaproteobacteria bacterium]